jgi:hypothetical protein
MFLVSDSRREIDAGAERKKIPKPSNSSGVPSALLIVSINAPVVGS